MNEIFWVELLAGVSVGMWGGFCAFYLFARIRALELEIGRLKYKANRDMIDKREAHREEINRSFNVAMMEEKKRREGGDA